MLDGIIDELLRSRKPYGIANLPDTPGLYAFFLRESASLSPFAGSRDLVYIGKSESSLRDRDFNQHFQTGASGHSTVRRSLGAIQRRDMGFRALPRGVRRTDQDLRCYRFRQEDEEKLSAWMQQNIEISHVVLTMPKYEIADLEKRVIEVLIPPLNIDGRSAKGNPHARALRALRAECREEAARA